MWTLNGTRKSQQSAGGPGHQFCSGGSRSWREWPWSCLAPASRHLCCAVVAALALLWPGVRTADGAEGTSTKTAMPSLESLLEQTVSAAAKYEQRTSEAPASVTIITSEEIRAFGYRTLADVLSGMRGFHLSSDRNYTYVGVRGFARPTDYNDRLLLLLDGHALNDNVFGASYYAEEQLGIDLRTVERIEVVRGPGAALYGNNAMFAVVNVVTKVARQIDGAQLGGQAGSHASIGGEGHLGKVYKNGTELLLTAQLAQTAGPDVYFYEFDSPQNNNGVASGLDWERAHGGMGVLRHGNVRVAGMLSSRSKGVPTASWSAEFNDARTQTLDARGFGELRYEREFGARHNVMCRAYYDYMHYDGVWAYGELPSMDSSDGRWVGGELHYRLDASSNNRLWIGTEYQHHLRSDYQSWDQETVYFRGDFPFNSIALYLGDEYQPRTDVSLSFGLRWDDTSTSRRQLTPRLGLVYTPRPSTAIKLLYGSAFRAANVNERQYEDPLAGYKSNPHVGPEKLVTSEIVLEHRLSGHAAGTLCVYENRVQGLIDTVLDPADSLYYYDNTGSVRASGIELELRSRWSRGLGGYWNYALQNSNEEATGLRTTNAPRHLMKLGAYLPIVLRTQVAFETVYESARLTLGRQTCPGHILANLRLSSRLGSEPREKVEVWLRVDNLFNAAYAVPGGNEHVQTTIPQARRAVYLGMHTGW